MLLLLIQLLVELEVVGMVHLVLRIFGFLENFFVFLRQSLALSPGWSAVEQSQLTATSTSQVQTIPKPLPLE